MKAKSKIEKVMHEYKEGDLHSGSKKGPVVKNAKQAIAIALSEARKKGAKIPKKKWGKKMDKKIKAVKNSLDKKMNKLVKEDVKRDKACDKAMHKKKK